MPLANYMIPALSRRIRAQLLVIAGACAMAFAAVVAQSAPPLEHFTVKADGHPMALWARRPANPKGAILLIHGRTWSALPDFDLQVPGEPRSALEALAAHGYAAYALDLRGYGGTPRDPSGWNTPHRAAADVEAVLAWIAQKEHGREAPVMMGWSNGSVVSQMVAQQRPQLMSALILMGYPHDPDIQIAPCGNARESPAYVKHR